MAQTILVVDDDKAIVNVLAAYLEQDGYRVLRAGDGETALHVLRREHPDLVILDLMMPNRNGWQTIEVVRADKSLAAMPIIVLTARVEDTDKIVGLELGADDYMTKPFNPREVVARVKALLRRVRLDQSPETAQPHVRAFLNLRMDLDQHSVTVDHVPVELTPTEFNLLETFLANPGYTLTRDDLLEKSLGYAYEGLGRTLDTYIRNLRRKIETGQPQAACIQTVYGVGYRLAGGER